MKSPLCCPTVVAVVLTSALAAGRALAQETAAPAAPTSLIARRCQAETAKLCAGIELGGGRLAQCLRGHQADLSEPCQAALAAGWRGARAGGSGPSTPSEAPAPAERPTVAAPAPPPPAPAERPAVAAPTPSPAIVGTKAPKVGAEGGLRPRAGMGMNAPSEWGPMAGMRKTCATEAAKLCKEAKPGHGRIAVCLSEHPQELSPPCKASVEQVMQQMSTPMEMHKACADDVKRLCGEVPPGTGRVAFCLGEHSAELSAECKKHTAEMKDGWSKRSFGPRTGTAPAITPPASARPAVPSPAQK